MGSQGALPLWLGIRNSAMAPI